MTEKEIHPDILKALVRGEIIGGEVIPEKVDDLYQWYLDTYIDMPEIMEILKEHEAELRKIMKDSFAESADTDPEALIRK